MSSSTGLLTGALQSSVERISASFGPNPNAVESAPFSSRLALVPAGSVDTIPDSVVFRSARGGQVYIIEKAAGGEVLRVVERQGGKVLEQSAVREVLRDCLAGGSAVVRSVVGAGAGIALELALAPPFGAVQANSVPNAKVLEGLLKAFPELERVMDGNGGTFGIRNKASQVVVLQRREDGAGYGVNPNLERDLTLTLMSRTSARALPPAALAQGSFAVPGSIRFPAGSQPEPLHQQPSRQAPSSGSAAVSADQATLMAMVRALGGGELGPAMNAARSGVAAAQRLQAAGALSRGTLEEAGQRLQVLEGYAKGLEQAKGFVSGYESYFKGHPNLAVGTHSPQQWDEVKTFLNAARKAFPRDEGIKTLWDRADKLHQIRDARQVLADVGNPAAGQRSHKAVNDAVALLRRNDPARGDQGFQKIAAEIYRQSLGRAEASKVAPQAIVKPSPPICTIDSPTTDNACRKAEDFIRDNPLYKHLNLEEIVKLIARGMSPAQAVDQLTRLSQSSLNAQGVPSSSVLLPSRERILEPDGFLRAAFVQEAVQAYERTLSPTQEHLQQQGKSSAEAGKLARQAAVKAAIDVVQSRYQSAAPEVREAAILALRLRLLEAGQGDILPDLIRMNLLPYLTSATDAATNTYRQTYRQTMLSSPLQLVESRDQHIDRARSTALDGALDTFTRFYPDSGQARQAAATELRRRLKGEGIDPSQQLESRSILPASGVVPGAEAPLNMIGNAVRIYGEESNRLIHSGVAREVAQGRAIDAALSCIRQAVADHNAHAPDQGLDATQVARAFLKDILKSFDLAVDFAPKSETENASGGYKRNRLVNATDRNNIPADFQYGLSTPNNEVGFFISDPHGHPEELEAMIQECLAYKAKHPGKAFTWIFLGDYIDKGTKGADGSAQVVQRLIDLKAQHPEDRFSILGGNHDFEWMQPFIRGEASPKKIRDWLTVRGGADALKSWERLAKAQGFTFDLSAFDLKNPPKNNLEWYRTLSNYVRTHLPKPHLDFFLNLERYYKFGDYLGIHASVRPGETIERLDRDKIAFWGREQQLDQPPNLVTSSGQPIEKIGIISGHTIHQERGIRAYVDEKGNQQILINIDGGAAVHKGMRAAIADGKTLVLPEIDQKRQQTDVVIQNGKIKVFDGQGHEVTLSPQNPLENYLRMRVQTIPARSPSNP